MLRLLMLATAPVIETADGGVLLDTKFVSGMKLVCQKWRGPVSCILRRGAADIPFGTRFDSPKFEYDLQVIDRDERITCDTLDRYDVVLATGDNHRDLDMAGFAGRTSARIVYAIEYTLETRLQIARLDRSRNLPRRLRATLWNMQQERRRRNAFRLADGIQANGYPAFAAYAGLNSNTMLYLDNRMRPDMLADDDEMAARVAHLRGGGPIRLVNSGRLETMKGAQDLVPVACKMRELGVDFTLDIFGAGSLRDRIAAEIEQHGLGDRIRLHAPVDFETELVPTLRGSVDIFLSCHLQSDPSCSYLEAMGCGVPVVGYDNEMLKGVLGESQAGTAVPLGDTGALAGAISRLDRGAIAKWSGLALDFARRHDFEKEFVARLDHLQETCSMPARAVR